MSKFDEYFSEGVKKVTSKRQEVAPVYTGAYERVTIQANDQFHLLVLMHKGKVIAVLYGDRVLPYVTEQVAPDQIVSLQNTYRRGLAGLIDRLVLRVAKS